MRWKCTGQEQPWLAKGAPRDLRAVLELRAGSPGQSQRADLNQQLFTSTPRAPETRGLELISMTLPR